MKPGSNWGETTGQIVRFVRNPPLHKGEGFIDLRLMDEPAAAIPVNSNSSIPTSEYLGKLDRWHVYYLASEKALAAWPTAKEDVKRALTAKPEMQPQADWSEAVGGVKARLSVDLALKPIVARE